MAIFLQWVVPVLILVITLVITIKIPANQQIQVIAPLFTGVSMYILKSFVGIPDVVIESLDREIAYGFRGNTLVCCTKMILKNRSATGIGTLQNLIVRIFVNSQHYIDVPVEHGEPDIIGFRFESHGLLPTSSSGMLWFTLENTAKETIPIAGKPAEVRLEVVGQGVKRYKAKMSENPS